MADVKMNLEQATAYLDEFYNMDDIVSMNRFGVTLQHFPKMETWKGGMYHMKFQSEMFTGATMSSSLESDAPAPRNITELDLEIREEDLRKIQSTMQFTLPAQTETADTKHSVESFAPALYTQSLMDLGEKRNQALHQNADGVKALVSAKYLITGGTYTPVDGSLTTAFLSIDNGAIASFQKGEILDIREGADGADVQVTVKVTNVVYGTEFLGQDIGPGIVVAIDSDYNAGDAHLDGVADNDEIVRYGEADGSGFSMSLGTLCQRGANPGNYFNYDRKAAAYQFLLTNGIDHGTVDLDIDSHFGKMADIMGGPYGRAKLARRNRGFGLTDAVVALGPVDLINAVAKQAGDSSRRFTTRVARDFDSAKGQLVANAGWDGTVLHHPSMPPLALQAEPLAESNKIRVFEPSTMWCLRLGGKAPNWIRNDTGGRWHAMQSSTGRLTMNLQASMWIIETWVCDQPALWYSMEGVQTDLP